MTRDTIVVGDGGDVVNCAAKFVPVDRPGQWVDPGPLGCLGVGPPFAVAAKLLRPDQRVLYFGETRTVATALPTTRYDLMVEALGGRGAFITDPREIGPALARALASDEVWCLNVVLDPAAYRKSGQVSTAI